MGTFGVDKDTSERVLNHSLGEIVEIYDLNEYVRQKHIALEKWEAYLRMVYQRVPPNPSASEQIARCKSNHPGKVAGNARELNPQRKRLSIEAVQRGASKTQDSIPTHHEPSSNPEPR